VGERKREWGEGERNGTEEEKETGRM